MKNKIIHMAEIFKMLSNDIRLCILVNLCINAEIKVTELQECSKASQSLVSQQLAKLRIANIISADKRGNEVYYSIKDNEIKEIINNTILKDMDCKK